MWSATWASIEGGGIGGTRPPPPPHEFSRGGGILSNGPPPPPPTTIFYEWFNFSGNITALSGFLFDWDALYNVRIDQTDEHWSLYQNVPYEERLCIICNSGNIEDEFHCFMSRSAYNYLLSQIFNVISHLVPIFYKFILAPTILIFNVIRFTVLSNI